MNTFYSTSVHVDLESIRATNELWAKLRDTYPEPDMTFTISGKPRECSIDEWKSTAP